MGLIAVVAIQRAIHKIFISVFLSREFKHDETNRAWWTGRWYGRGLGNHAMSQPAREFIVKIIELSLWSSDLLICHFLLFMLTLPVLVPYADRIHSTLLCESLSPSAEGMFANAVTQSGSARRSKFGHLYTQSSRRLCADGSYVTSLRYIFSYADTSLSL